MPEYFDKEPEARVAERSFGGWRVIASAWAIAIIVVLLFSGVQALASRHAVAPQQTSLVGAVIPRHDAGCAGLGEMTPSGPNCHSATDDLARAEAQAEIGGSYGW
jgi:hypothetical protein